MGAFVGAAVGAGGGADVAWAVGADVDGWVAGVDDWVAGVGPGVGALVGAGVDCLAVG